MSWRRAVEVADDLVNPIVVKELRQAMQGKFVMAVLMLFLLVAVGAMWGFLFTQQPDEMDADAGRVAFGIFGIVLLATCMLFVPTWTGARLTAERTETNSDLMFVTTLKPRQIVAGKVISAVVISSLITFACLPFITLTYLLRGIDVPTMFVLMFFGSIAVLAGIQFAVLLGSLPVSKGLRGLLGLLGFLGGASILQGVLGVSAMLLYSGVGSMIGTWDFWRTALLVLMLVFMGVGLMFMLATALMSPASANRALPVRLYLTGAWLATGIAAQLASVGMGESWPVAVWAGVFGGLFCLAFLSAVSEREALGPRVRRKIPRRGFARVPAVLFFSGAAGGLLWAVLLYLLTLVVEDFWRRRLAGPYMDPDLARFGHQMLALGLYFLGYALMGLFLRRAFLSRLVKPAFTWMVGVLLVVLCTVIPLLVAFFANVEIESGRNSAWLMANPFALFFYEYELELFTTFAAALTLVGAALNAGWVGRQLRAFVPYEREAEEAAVSVEPA